MAADDRPLSPHLQVYRWQLTSALSILHRMTGLALVVGSLLLAYWLIAAAAGPDAFARAQRFLGSWIGILLLFGWTIAFYYHLLNGVRHLVWDTGHWLDLKSVYTSGWAVVIGTAALTLITWIAGVAVRGGAA